jgi:GNAT superfamily N-acetyltransferase
MPDPGPLLIRPARAADLPALRAILWDTFESTWAPNVAPAAAERFRAQDRPGDYVAQRGLLFRVAERDGEPVGLVDWEGDFVHALHVRSTHARTGVGGRLMDAAEEEIRRAGLPAVRLETDTFNARSQAFYAARGYVEIDRYPDREWDSGLTTVLLRKLLGP